MEIVREQLFASHCSWRISRWKVVRKDYSRGYPVKSYSSQFVPSQVVHKLSQLVRKR